VKLRVLFLASVLSICSIAAENFQIVTLSAAPDRVTGGDVLVRVDLPDRHSGMRLADVATVRLNGADVTAAFREDGTVLLSGLKLGRNRLEVYEQNEANPVAQVTLRNHPITGPVFSGPHQQPFICQTAEFQLVGGNTLGQPLDPNCTARLVVQYVYRSTAGGPLKPLLRTGELPPDIALTTTSTGQTVPYIVRVETGTINRAIYQIAVLQDPTTKVAGWNQRLLYSFGGGCTEGWYRQGASTALQLNNAFPGTLADFVLSAGYAYASASLNVFGNNCQDVTAAETMMMVKERFIEMYGPPLFTFGRGGSGGAYQQIQIADNYPGLLDGIIPSATFPDVLATIQFLTDGQLLTRYFANSALTDQQKLAISGAGVLPTITSVSYGAGRINPRTFCPPVLPAAQRYDPVLNPKGARCDVFDHAVNVYGRNPVTGFARRPIDNTGVQYGLNALRSGTITVAQFLDLNERIGGYDHDANFVPMRSVADPDALRIAHATGRVTNGGGGLARIPIIDLRGYLDLAPKGDIHLKYHSFGLRDRLIRSNGTAANEVMVLTDGRQPKTEERMIASMDQWLTTLREDRSDDSPVVKIVRARPADLEDGCYTPSGDFIVEWQRFAGGECNKYFPTFPSPRMVAGGPTTNDVLKCQLKPLDWREYGLPFTEEQKARLRAIFPAGVCDWSKPGVSQGKLQGVWLSY
jgi:hypothetical protein